MRLLHRKDSVVLVDKDTVPQIMATGEKKGAMVTLATVESQPNKAAERGKAMRQVIAAFVANLGTINTGLIFGFSAVVIPQLQAADSLIPVDESQSSWVGTYYHW